MLVDPAQPGKVETGVPFITAPEIRSHVYRLILLDGDLHGGGVLTTDQYARGVGRLVGTLQRLRDGTEVHHAA